MPLNLLRGGGANGGEEGRGMELREKSLCSLSDFLFRPTDFVDVLCSRPFRLHRKM